MAIVPSGSVEPAPLKVTAVPVGTGLGVAVKEAVGGRLVTVSARVVVAVPPLLSVTRRPTVTLPAVAKVLLVVAVAPCRLVAAVAVEVPFVFGDRAVGVGGAAGVEADRVAAHDRVGRSREGGSGRRFWTVRTRVVVAVAPSLSVTRRPIVGVLALA